MTTSGSHRDTYVEEYHRHFFTNYAHGTPPRACGIIEKHISGLIGMIPLIVYYADDPDSARQLAFEHLRLTHLGDRMAAAGNLLLDILLPVLGGESLEKVIVQKIMRQDNPLLGHPLLRWLNDRDEIVVGRRLSSACYVEDAIPAIIYLALKYHHDVEHGLIANTNVGGDNAGRGACVGGSAWGGQWASGFSGLMGQWIAPSTQKPDPTMKGTTYACDNV